MGRKEIVNRFAVEGDFIRAEEYGSGHINRTELIELSQGGQAVRYILQRINTQIFANVSQLMENIVSVTSFLSGKIMAQGGDPDRETLQVIQTKDGGSYWKDGADHYRMYRFVEGAASYDAAKEPGILYESGKAFGRFQQLLSDYPADTLHETIVDFHNTPKRFETFCEAVDADRCGRAASVAQEISFIKERKSETQALTGLLENGELPLRVVHNDTKLNNVLFDKNTKKSLCVIDLDTVMPGTLAYDFGDAIRFGANTAAEDEPDVSKVSLDLELYRQYASGYLSGCGGSLTEKELEMLPMGAKLMTLECGMRFLTDYLSGDTYFRIHHKRQNLDRCRTQLALVADMERKWEQMARLSASE